MTAKGRAQIRKTPEPWIAEPDGVSIRWHHGVPLGKLLVAVRDDAPAAQAPANTSDEMLETTPKNETRDEPRVSFADPLAAGLKATFRAPRTGTLYLKIHDHPAERADNAGGYEVEVVRGK
ncbi:MAG: hypothetical protein QM811_24995 [Pirellulales bacterium]